MLYKNAFEQLQNVLTEIGEIKADLQKAYDHKKQEDYEACLWMLRNTLEGICKNIYANEFTTTINGLELRQLIRKLEETNKIPGNILPHVRTVQTFGNYGSHPDNTKKRELNEKMVQPPITSMEVIMAWFINEYHCLPEHNSKDSASDFNLLNYIPLGITKAALLAFIKICQ